MRSRASNAAHARHGLHALDRDRLRLGRRLSLPLATGRAREFVQKAIVTAPGLGKGHGPLNFFAEK